MQINFPFFVFEEGAGYYCGKIKEDKSGLLIEMHKTLPISDIHYMPEISPMGITTSFLDKLVRKCRDEIDSELNAIVVHHYVAQPLFEISTSSEGLEVQHVIIAYEEDVGKEDVERSSHHLYLNYFQASPTGVCDGKLHVIIISNKRYAQGKKYRSQGGKYSKVMCYRKKDGNVIDIIDGEIEYEDADPIKHMTSWPLIARVPMNIETTDIVDLSGNSRNLKLAEVLLLEVLLGSIIMVKKKGELRGRQLPLLIPTPLLSLLHYKQYSSCKQSHSPSTPRTSSRFESHLLALPSTSYVSIGGIMFSVDLNNLFEKLSDYLVAKLNEAYRLLEELKSEKLVIQVNFRNCGVSGDQHIEGLSAEAILKTITDNFILVGKTIGFPRNIRKYEEKIRHEIRLPHRIVRLEVPIPLHDIGFQRLGLVDNRFSKHIYVAYDVVRDRTEYLESILKLRMALRNRVSSYMGSSYDGISLWLAAFLPHINDRVVKTLEKEGMPIGSRASLVSIDGCILARRMALLLLEYGLHALSHLLLKYLHEVLKVKMDTLRELVVLSLGGEDRWNSVKPSPYYMNVAINGFRYRLSSSIGGVRGVVMITSNEPFTYRSWESLIPKVFKLEDFVSSAFEMLGKDLNSDRCLGLWEDEKDKMMVRLRLYDADNRISNFMEDLKNLIGDSGRALPLLEVRAIMKRSLGKERLESLKPYLEAIYTATIPFCFDGCYNCVLIERQCLSNPFSSEWVVSKSVARLILSELSRGAL